MKNSLNPNTKNKLNFLRLDLFGISPCLYFQGREKQGSCLGLILTFLICIFTIICFIYFGENLYYRKDPSVTTTHQFEIFPEKFVIDPKKFPLLLEINDPPGQNYFTNPLHLKAKISQYTFLRENSSQKLTIKNYDMEICTPQHFSSISPTLQEYFLSKNLSNFFCIPENLTNLTIQGSFDQDLYQNVKLSFSLCNKTLNNSCNSYENITKFMSLGYVGLYFLDSVFDATSFENAYKIAPHEFSTNFVLNSQKSINVFLKNHYVSSNDGYMFSTARKNHFVGYDGFQEYNFLLPNDEFFMIYLRLRQEDVHYSRNYFKIQDLLARIGGFINVFWILLQALHLIFARLLFFKKLIFDVFTVKALIQGATPCKNINMKESIAKNQEKRNDVQRNLKENIEISKEINKNSTYLPKKILLEDDNPMVSPSNSENFCSNPLCIEEIKDIKLNLLDYLYYYTGYFQTPEREKKKIILLKGLSVLKKNLDVRYIIEKFYEIEKIKQFLLTEKQLKDFNEGERPELMFIRDDGRSSVVTTIMKKRISMMERSPLDRHTISKALFQKYFHKHNELQTKNIQEEVIRK